MPLLAFQIWFCIVLVDGEAVSSIGLLGDSKGVRRRVLVQAIASLRVQRRSVLVHRV